MAVSRHGLQAKGVLARGDHVQRNRVTVPAGMHVFGLEPRAQARIDYFRLALPEIRPQSTLDPEVIQLQFD
jgi:hypothetical protein